MHIHPYIIRKSHPVLSSAKCFPSAKTIFLFYNLDLDKLTTVYSFYNVGRCIKYQCQGFHGAGGGGGLGNMGGTAEKIVFLSIFSIPLPDNDTKAATKPAFPARVGSV